MECLIFTIPQKKIDEKKNNLQEWKERQFHSFCNAKMETNSQVSCEYDLRKECTWCNRMEIKQESDDKTYKNKEFTLELM